MLSTRHRTVRVVFLLSVTAAIGLPFRQVSVQGEEWKDDVLWPEPQVISPGPVGGPPSDAVVLFDGKSLDAWEGGERWLIEDGAAIAHGGSIVTKQGFGDCQLHVEWATPKEIVSEGQDRGNSGIYLMSHY